MEQFSRRNRERCESPRGFNHKLEAWSLSDWVCALAGEVGEAANIVKKLNRIRDGLISDGPSVAELRLMLAKELADVMCYVDLVAQAAGFDPEAIREAKFQEVSRKLGYVG